MEYIKIRNWDKWQTYRKDRGQPPWIKIHRQLMRNIEWISLTDEDKGHLLSIWLLAADRDGYIPEDPIIIQKLCYLEKPPNLQKLIDLEFISVTHAEKKFDIDFMEADAEEGKIYFIQYDDAIKIGFSKNPWARLNSLKTAMPNEPLLLAHFPGTKDQEQRLHKLFEPFRVNREWYKPNKYLFEITTRGLPDDIPASVGGLVVTPKAE